MAKFSIITICKNEKNFIEQTILSIVNQTFKDFEFIIIDGVSTDGTLNIIKQYSNKINILISEKDDGIYDAMNKGIKLSSGDYLCFINANDFFYDNNVLENINKIITKNPNIEFIFGEGVIVSSDGKNLISKTRQYEISHAYDFFERGMFNHQSIIYKRDLFKKYGFYSYKFKIISDNYFNLLCTFKHKCKVFYTNMLISKRTEGGISYDYNLLKKEKRKVLKEFFPFYSIFYKYIRLIRYFFPGFYSILNTLFLKHAYKNSKLNFEN